jgi:hypothetical protein
MSQNNKVGREVRRILNYRNDIAMYLVKHDRTLAEEYALILEKKSNLTLSQRNYILTYYEELENTEAEVSDTEQ